MYIKLIRVKVTNTTRFWFLYPVHHVAVTTNGN